jgi:hypothetical protein
MFGLVYDIMCLTDLLNIWFQACNFRTCDCPWQLEYLPLVLCGGTDVYSHVADYISL